MKLLNNIPNMKLALVSKLNAQSRIHAHTDKGIWIEEDQKYVTYNDKKLHRVHLGLSIPDKGNEFDCAIRIANETRAWKEGECLMFDCTTEHEAWNDTDEDRIVLIVDVIKQGETMPENEDYNLIKKHFINMYM